MKTMQEEKRSAREHGLPGYFDMQARIGHTKHVGGWKSTQEIAEMMSLGPGQELLYVGSGSGVAAIQIARTYGCRIVGVDVMDEMVAAAEAWAERKKAGDQVKFRVADAQNLPFEHDRFDAILCESVNTFIPDLGQALSEYMRVVKPGGYVGWNEPIWYVDPPERGAQLIQDLTGQHLRRSHEWIAILEKAGLQEIHHRTYPVEMKQEMRSQLGFLSTGDYLQILWRAVKNLFTDKGTRGIMRLALREPRSAYEYMGYGLYVGKVPDGS